jgi:hypothetical protein
MLLNFQISSRSSDLCSEHSNEPSNGLVYLICLGYLVYLVSMVSLVSLVCLVNLVCRSGVKLDYRDYR